MRKFEKFCGMTLIVLFVYSFVEMLFKVPGVLKYSPTFFFPFRVDGVVLGIGTGISVITSLLFPMWDIGKYLGTNDPQEIFKFKMRYKANYDYIIIGYIGLILWYNSKDRFEIFWILGSILIILFFFCLAQNKFSEREHR